MKYRRALLIGRFQPFHKGHLFALKRALDEANEVILLIGSSNKSFELDNPFTIGERIEMIHYTLREEGVVDRVLTIHVPDVMNNATWTANVNALCPSYDVVFTNNPLVELLFQQIGKPVVRIGFHERTRYDGTKIRSLMARDRAWEQYVPPAVATYIRSIGGVERLRHLLKSDKVTP